MTQEDKNLLLKDLCARLPYGVMIQHPDYDEPEVLDTILTPDAYEGGGIQCSCDDSRFEEIHSLKDCKPYLRSMSSMTEEEKKEYQSLCEIHFDNDADGNFIAYYFDSVESFDYLNKNMFDFRELIPAGRAIEVTEDNNPYKD